MRMVILALLYAVGSAPCFAMSGGTQDGEDRFPYVVEIKFQHKLACAGTVLYPRIVVTAAHCLQHKVRLPGGYFYIDEYAKVDDLTVTVARNGGVTDYDVGDVAVSPAWRSAIAASNAVSSSNRSERFAHDIVLVITKEPIEVGLPPSVFRLAALSEANDANCARNKTGRGLDNADAEALLRERLMQRLGHHAVVVAFGAETCTSRFCAQAGTRRYQSVSLRESAYCFDDRASRSQDTVSESAARSLPPSVWCLESSVLPGDSGGALLIEGPMGELYYLGVISAQQGRRVALVTAVTDKRSLATALFPSFNFVLAGARKLGYAR
jgi:hypothetical protein